MSNHKTSDNERLLRDAKIGGSRVARLSRERPGGSHGRRKQPRSVAKRRAIEEHS